MKCYLIYLSRRLLQVLFVLLGISLITFLLAFLIPADPVRMIAGRSATAETIASIRSQLGLDQPIPIQYLQYLGRLLHGDLGRSYIQRTQVLELILSRLPATGFLMLGAIAFELLIGLTAGIYAAVKRDTGSDRLVMVMSFIGVSAPQFAVGLILLYLFSYQLGWFPLGGYGSWKHLVLPALTLGIAGGGWYSRMMRSSMVDVMRQGYIRTARAKGASGAIVVFKHALRNAIPPIIAMIGLDIGIFMSGAVVVESVFGLPGIGQLIWQAIQVVDIPVITGVVLVSAVAIVLGNLLADLVMPLVNPRVKLE
ncbi:ABC transporter permease [Oscillatoria sp. FACHB-1407]|uniref:ABC transporter permease n=1 Tax=Oscillatoria sp. FACHB-1407 TaxID=2692847 RepID=UPI0016878306|nr:ABC transporter permease [Oscillatoria sp. FACHB-1407]MBD2463709.1 ABC transporter permease [Oscillatoria sp. FACHB-1407]